MAEALVAWASADDLPYLDGLPVEPGYVKPWMLGLYLRSLAAYLDMQAEYGRVDPSGGRATYLALAGWLRTRALIDLPPIDTGPRAAFPYQWEFLSGNTSASVDSWLLLGADALAYAYLLNGDPAFIEDAERLFRTGSRDPWFEGDVNTYSATKETANVLTFGNTFLTVWSERE